MTCSTRSVCILAAMLVAGGLSSAAHATISIVDLGATSLRNAPTTVYRGALNNMGQVVATHRGAAVTDDDRAFRAAANNDRTYLGTLGGTSSNSTGVNDLGQVAGVSKLAGNTAERAFRTDPNGAITADSDLGTLGGGRTSAANDINASGQVVGYAVAEGTDAGKVKMFAFRTAPNGKITEESSLGAFDGGHSYAYAINASGQTVGFSSTGDPTLSSHAFRTTAMGTISADSDLGTLGGKNSQARDINDSGQVVGIADLESGESHAFRTAPNGLINAASDLSVLAGVSGVPLSINNAGQVVGYAYSINFTTRAFFVDSSGGVVDLNSLLPAGSAWTLETATSINDNGQIAGYGLLDGQTHLFLMSGVVPEPATFAVLAAGAIAFRRRRV